MGNGSENNSGNRESFSTAMSLEPLDDAHAPRTSINLGFSTGRFP
jgi:hypothetical protein